MKTLSIALCFKGDIDTLIELRLLQLLEERGESTLTASQIRAQIMTQIERGSSAYFLKWDADVVGFAMVDTGVKPYTLKSFYASRNFRRSGMKSLNFQKLVDMLETDVLDVEVYAGNTSSRLFWETFGFKERSVCLRYSRAK